MINQADLGDEGFSIRVTLDTGPLSTLAQMLSEVASIGTATESGGEPAAATAGADARAVAMEQLRQLKELHDDGVLTDEEFNSKRQRYLDALATGGPATLRPPWQVP